MDILSTNPAYLSWRIFDGLDLPVFTETPKTTNSGFCNFENSTPKKIAEYVKHRELIAKNFPFPFPPWASAKPIFSNQLISNSNPGIKTCEEMAKYIQEDIELLVEQIDFNGLNFVSDYIDFYKREKQKNPDDSTIQIFHRFKPNLKEEATEHRGTACVGKAWEIKRRLQLKKIDSHIVVELEGIKQIATHSAVVVPAQDGILLVEIEQKPPIIHLRLGEPFVLHPNPGSVVSFELKYDPNVFPPLHIEKITSCSERVENQFSIYPLQPVINPDESVMKRCLIEAPFYPISTGKRAGQALHAVQVNIALEKITFNQEGKKCRLFLDSPINEKKTLTNESGEPLSPGSSRVFLSGLDDSDEENIPDQNSFYSQFQAHPKKIKNDIKKIIFHITLLKNTRRLAHCENPDEIKKNYK